MWRRVRHTGKVFGRFAPSPSGRLHLGNLRTALAAWLLAGLSGRRFLVRIEDLDPVSSSSSIASDQLDDLRTLGIDFEPDVVFQSGRVERYTAVLEHLRDRGLVYPCFCSRREIAEAAHAPHDPVPAALADPVADTDAVLDLVVERPYPGTCRGLDASQVQDRLVSGARAAWRLRAEAVALQVNDDVVGSIRAFVDDMVLQRADGVIAYHLAVVVDDAAQQITQVVRGDDLLASTPRQVYLQRLLGYPTPQYVHLPLVIDPDGRRLAKRDGAVTLEGLATEGVGALAVLRGLGASLGIAGTRRVDSAEGLLEAAAAAGFGLGDLVRAPIVTEDLVALIRASG